MQSVDRCFYLQLGNYNSFEGVLYCRPHFDQLFKRTGSLDKSFEGKNKEKLI
jgi:cysteine/glycine-rich protein